MNGRPSQERPRILYVLPEDFAFLTHRLPQARAADCSGFVVGVAAGDTGKGKAIEELGYQFFAMPMSRGVRGPSGILQASASLFRLMRRFRPDVVHNLSVNGTALGAPAAWATRTPFVINAITGLGSLFLARTPKNHVMRNLFLPGLKQMMKRPGWYLLFQNEDDRNLFETKGVVRRERTFLIRGSGVDVSRFKPLHPSHDATGGAKEADEKTACKVVFAGRMLKDKGVLHLVKAADILARENVHVEILLCGRVDPANPVSLTEDDMQQIQARPNIQWLGHVSDMLPIWQGADIAVLPSQREGLPMTLLEAAACGLPLVGTDVPGCREIVRHNQTGLLVPWEDPPALAAAIAQLVRDPHMRKTFGRTAREIVEREFSSEIVFRQTEAIYGKMREEILRRRYYQAVG